MTDRRQRASRGGGVWRVGVACAAAIVTAVALSWAFTPGDQVVGQESSRDAAAMPQPEPNAAWPQVVATAARTFGASAAEAAALQGLYGPAGLGPLWFSGGTLTSQARETLTLLRSAARHGLEPAGYLLGPVAALEAGVPDRAEARAEFDVVLSLGVLRYMRHLHAGRVDPRALGMRIDPWREPHDGPAMLREAVAAGRVVAAIESLAPPLAVYARLVDALSRYREIAKRRDPEVPPFVRAVRPGEPYAGAHALGVLLEAAGDLTAGDVPLPDADLYDGALVEGARRFQARHGLTPDGVLGERTVAAARVPAVARVNQIELALERLRWLPRLGARRLVVVNIPMFRLWAWDTLDPSRPPAFSSAVIVGRAARTETPVFVAAMDHVIFRPFWNVPPSILRDEILPAMQRDPGYLARHQMDVVGGPGDDARPVPVGPDTLEALAAGTLRVRQRPGAQNALGLVKFVFANPEGVYMHGTPTPSLFARDRRDFSHGCIRVADPSGLARWALDGADGWDAARIDAAMHADRSLRVDLAAPIDVVLFYMTAAVRPEDGAVRFADDIYGHDAALARALARATAAH